MLSLGKDILSFGFLMDMTNQNLFATASENPLPPLNSQQKESLLLLIVINYAEERDLLSAEQLEDARASLRTLFLQATGEETMLRKVIGILKVNRALNKTFSEMANVLAGIRKSHQALVNKHEALKQQLASLAITPEENTHFIGPLLEFSSDFVRAVVEFDRQMTEYKEAKEIEARSAHVFRLAREARERLKQRFERGAVEDSGQEQAVKQKVYQSFNYAEAESDYQYNRRSANAISNEIARSLKDFKQMCQLSMKPGMRSQGGVRPEAGKPSRQDIYSIALAAIDRFPRLHMLIPVVQEHLRLYQRSFGMFMLDFDKFNNALGPMIENTEDYFNAKEQDADVRATQQKLEEIEALIAFIEEVSLLLRDGEEYAYPRFSTAISSYITRATSKWSAIAEQLLHMKVAAEAELTTRLA
jgi:hypothetical protein